MCCLAGQLVVMLMLQGICDCSLHVFHIVVLVVEKLEVLQDILICFCLQQNKKLPCSIHLSR